jgi:hypothetical protein
MSQEPFKLVRPEEDRPAGAAQAAPPGETPPQAASTQPEGRLRRLGRALQYLLLGLLVGALAGFFVAVTYLYAPAARQLSEALQSIEQAETQVKELQAETARLAAFQTSSGGLQLRLERAELHVAVLSARSDVAAALLALERKDATKARLSLSSTARNLKALAGLLPADQRSLAGDLQERLTLAQGELETNPFAAQSDLNVLASGLIEIENAYFAGP